ncbi:MAG: hypothetical protein ACP5D7_22225 [Limnospira sp.]
MLIAIQNLANQSGVDFPGGSAKSPEPRQLNSFSVLGSGGWAIGDR